MTQDQQFALYLALIPAIGVVLATGIPSYLTLLQSRANKKAIADNTEMTKDIKVSVDGRMEDLLKATKDLATNIERVAGDRRTTQAVAIERARLPDAGGT